MKAHWLFALAGLVACGSVGPDTPGENMLTIDYRGHLIHPISHEELVGPGQVDTTGLPAEPPNPQDLWFDEVIDRMLASTQPLVDRGQPRRLMLFVHGGLNSWKSSAESAASMVKRIKIQAGDPYPIFVQWDSDGVTSLFEDWTSIRQGRSVGGAWYLATPLFIVRDLACGIVKWPINFFYEFENEWQTAPGITNKSDDKYCVYRALPTTIDPKARERIGHGEDKRGFGMQIVDYTSKFVMFPVRLAVMAPLAGVGPSAWENMRRRATMLFRTEDELKATSVHNFASGPLSRFLRRLETRRKERSGETWEITLAGHSMGSFAVNQILRDYSDLPVVRIVYLASACSVRDYQSAVIPFLVKNTATTVQHVVLESTAEEQEIYGVPFLELAPRGSLLVWIDMYLSKPMTRLDRTAGRYINLIPADSLMDTMTDANGRPLRERVTVRQFDIADDVPVEHGDVDSIAFWRIDETLPKEFAKRICEN